MFNEINNNLTNLENYCQKYGWPKRYSNPKIKEEQESTKWLESLGFYDFNNYFKYNQVLDEHNLPIIYKFLNIIFKYCYSEHKMYKSALIKLILKIQEYCQKYHAFPIFYYEVKSNQEEESNVLINYLASFYDFNNKKFLYPEIYLTDGKSLKNIVDNLITNYYRNYNTNIEQNLKLLENYCTTYQTFPTFYDNPQNKLETTSNYLFNWLKEINYREPNFKYASITDKHGFYIQDIINRYYNIYHNTFKKSLNIINNSDNIHDIAQYIIELSNNLNNFDLYLYYYNTLTNLITKYHLELDINDIINDLLLDDLNKLETYQTKYFKYLKEQNNALAQIYYELYTYIKEENNKPTNHLDFSQK